MINSIKNYNRIHQLVYNLNNRKTPLSITIDITNRCNLRCLHCFNESGNADKYSKYENELSDEMLLSIANDVAAIKPEQVCICGGEPLLRKEVLYKMVGIIRKAGIIVNMVSNGLLFDDEVAEKLIAADLSSIQFSIDGLEKAHDIFRNCVGAFQRTISSIEICKNKNIEWKISSCPNKYNFYSFETFIEFMEKFGCKELRMMPLLPLGRSEENLNDICLDSLQQFELVSMINSYNKKNRRMHIEWGDPLEHIALIKTTKRKYPVNMGITSNGCYSITPYLPIELGNVHDICVREAWKSGFSKAWDNKRIQKYIEDVNNIYDFSKKDRLCVNIFDSR